MGSNTNVHEAVKAETRRPMPGKIGPFGRCLVGVGLLTVYSVATPALCNAEAADKQHSEANFLHGRRITSRRHGTAESL